MLTRLWAIHSLPHQSPQTSPSRPMSKTQEKELKIQLTNEFITKGKKPHFLNVVLAKPSPCTVSLRPAASPAALLCGSLRGPQWREGSFRHSDLSCVLSLDHSPLPPPSQTLHSSFCFIFWTVLISARNYLTICSWFMAASPPCHLQESRSLTGVTAVSPHIQNSAWHAVGAL